MKGTVLMTAIVSSALAIPGHGSEGREDSYELRRKLESPLPDGFPAPGPEGRVVLKTYPGARAARAEGGRLGGRNMAFWKLFSHIKRNQISMTSPVETVVNREGRESSSGGELMAFFYGEPGLGSPGRDAPEQGLLDMSVEVVDLPSATYLSFGFYGPESRRKTEEARGKLLEALATYGERATAAGPVRLLTYHSPFVRGDHRYFELQLPVRMAGEDQTPLNAENPPSTGTTTPVTKSESSETR